MISLGVSHRQRREALHALTGCLLIAAACTSQPGESAAPSSPTPTPRPTAARQRLCQPFPDRLIDEFIAAYNGRDLEVLQRLLTVEEILDLGAAPHAEAAVFEEVEGWARAGWSAGDRFQLAGYSAFSPGPRGFAMLVERRNRVLRRHGIDVLSMTLGASSKGCAIVRLESSGPVQARGQPCRFYEEFQDLEEVAKATPRACADGSGRFARQNHVAIWTGEEMLVWGGSRGGDFAEVDALRGGVVYRPVADSWSKVPKTPLVDPTSAVAVWTGDEMLVFGSSYKGRPHAAAFRPESRTWRPLAPAPIERWAGFTVVWTGKQVVAWGGGKGYERLPRRGAIYDPAADRWRLTAPAPMGGRYEHTAVWTGSEMIVWGGSDNDADLGDGAAYDPSANAWRSLPKSPLLPRQWLPAVWTGQEMIVWGGSYASSSRADGAAYSPTLDAWRRLARSPLTRRHWHSAIWTGRHIVLWGGYSGRESLNDGALYEPTTNSWSRMSLAPIVPRCHHSAVWSGHAMVVFGGYRYCGSPGHPALGDGAMYFPETDSWRVIVPKQ